MAVANCLLKYDVVTLKLNYAEPGTEFQDVFKDPIMFKRIADIEQLPTKDRECLLLTVDNFIKATKLNML